MSTARAISVCVFCAARTGNRPEFAAVTRAFGRLLAERGITLVYGGGRVGLMGEVASGALEAGGRVVGVIPRMLLDREVGHRGLSELEVVQSLSERKVRMAEISDVFVALPGGIGTLDELFEVWTWSQLEVQSKRCGLLNALGYYTPLIEFLDRAVEADFLRADHRAALTIDDDPGRLLDRLLANPTM